MAGTTPPTVIVVGAGIVGLTCAWCVAAEGARVSLVDPSPGRGASRAAGGMLGLGGEAWFGDERLFAWCRASAQAWPAFRERLERASGLAVPWCGTATLAVAATASDLPDLERRATLLEGRGVGVQRVGVARAVAAEPALEPRVAGALRLPEVAVDPRRVVEALLAALRGHGVDLHGAPATSVEPGRVHLADGTRLTGDHVVVAAGPDTARLDGVPAGVLDGLHPVKGQILRVSLPLPDRGTAAAVERLSHVVRGTVDGRTVYLVPHGPDRIAIGATTEEHDDEEVTAGAVHRLLDDALRFVPGLSEYRLDEALARRRPVTASGAPVVAQVEPGLVVATGHGRHGVLLAPATGDAVLGLVTGESSVGDVLETTGTLDPAGATGSDGFPEGPEDVVDPGRAALAVARRGLGAAAGGTEGARVGVAGGASPIPADPEPAGTVPRTVLVNGDVWPWDGELSVATVVSRLLPAFDGGRGVAVAVDCEVVPRARWDAVRVLPGQQVEVLTAIQGG